MPWSLTVLYSYTYHFRTHLALKAYQELLLTLDSMDRSGNPTLMESSKVVKSKTQAYCFIDRDMHGKWCCLLLL